MFVLDTNILVYYLAGDERVSQFIKPRLQSQEQFIIPTVCIVEFLSFPKVTQADEENFMVMIEQAEVLSLDFDNATMAAQLRRNYKLQVVDSVIAAATLSKNAILISRDQDFKKIREIEVLNV